MNEKATDVLREVRDWAVNELEFAKARAENLRVGGESYNQAIQAIKDLARMVDELAYFIGEKKYEWENENETTPDFHKPEEILHEVTPEPEPTPDPEPEPEPDVPIPDIADVREKMAAYKAVGVDIKAILTEFGLKNLSAAEPKDYNAILAKAAKAREALG